jgi:hypothetical protein
VAGLILTALWRTITPGSNLHKEGSCALIRRKPAAPKEHAGFGENEQMTDAGSRRALPEKH